jgi:ribosomal protein S12 methylthiotransferase
MKRVHLLMKTQQRIALENNERMKGKSMEVLVDGWDDTRQLYFGRTEGDSLEIDQLVWIKGKTVPGQWIRVSIESCTPYDLTGIVQESSNH